MRLSDAIREELGGTYSIGANFGYQKFPTSEYSITIQFGSDPQRVDELVKRVFQEIEKLKAEGPTEKQVTDEKQALAREFETNSKQNGYLLNQISLRYYNQEDPAGVWKVPEFYQKLDGPTIQQAAKQYLNTSRYIRVTLFPEKK
jgi:zinc protease